MRGMMSVDKELAKDRPENTYDRIFKILTIGGVVLIGTAALSINLSAGMDALTLQERNAALLADVKWYSKNVCQSAKNDDAETDIFGNPSVMKEAASGYGLLACDGNIVVVHGLSGLSCDRLNPSYARCITYSKNQEN